MAESGKKVIMKILKQLNLIEGIPESSEDAQLAMIEDARRDWQSAREYFNIVTDPELIDHAIYAMEAAEKRYVYLLRKAREEKRFKENKIS